MPQYEIEWTETRTFKARIAIPTDDLVIQGTTNGHLISWLNADLANEAPGADLLEQSEPVVEFKTIGRVFQVLQPVDPAFPDIQTTEEQVRPLVPERRDVGQHIRSAFKGLPPGSFLSLAQIRKHQSSVAAYGEIGVGAMAARLFPHTGPCTIPGIEGALGGPLKVKGARNTEVIS